MKYRLHLYNRHLYESVDSLRGHANNIHGYFLAKLASEMLKHRTDVELCAHEHTEQLVTVRLPNAPEYSVWNPTFDYLTIENTLTGKFSVLDFKDGPTSALVLQSDPNFAGALITMYEPQWVNDSFSNPELIEPYLFFDQMPNLTLSMQEEIQELHTQASDERLFMAATLGDESFYSIQTLDKRVVGRRHLARVLAERYPDEVLIWDREQKQERPAYWRQAAKHRWNLFLPGHPWCYREHEYWRLGLATISLNLWHPLKIALNPGEHYVSVQVPQAERDYTGCSMCPEQHADAVIQTFRRVKYNESLRKRIAMNAQRRMNLANVEAVAESTLERLIEIVQ